MDALRAPDLAIRRLADDQHGIVTRDELLAAGLRRGAIAYRVKAGRLVVLSPGVYAVGHSALRREGRWLAAARACGRQAVLSHGDAAALHGLRPAQGVRIEVTTPSRSGRRAPDGIRLHRAGTLTPAEVTEVDRIPVTTVPRVLLDLAPTLRPRQLEELIAQADRRQVFDLRAVRAIVALHPRRPGAPALATLLDRLEGCGPADVRSPAETAFLQLCDDHAIPAPVANVTIAGFLVDFHWPGTRLVVEVDGYAFHAMPTAFERDRQRDQALAVHGFVVARFAKRQLDVDPAGVAARVRALLVRSGALSA